MKEVSCRKIGADLFIDGCLDKPEWAQSQTVDLVDTITGGKPRQATCVKLAWNEQFLYFGFCCEDTHIHATLTGYNDLLCVEEVVEVFIDDDNDQKTYIELEINPLNACLHYCIHNSLQHLNPGNPPNSSRFIGFARLEKSVRSAVCRDDGNNRWSVEAAIPFSEFLTARNNPPREGDRWRMNFYRIDRPKDGQDEYSAWSPTEWVNFHKPECFGEVVFSGSAPGAND